MNLSPPVIGEQKKQMTHPEFNVSVDKNTKLSVKAVILQHVNLVWEWGLSGLMLLKMLDS